MKKTETRKRTGKTTSSLVRETPMLVMTRIWIYLQRCLSMDYFTSFDKFREQQLPPKEACYSNLTESHIEDDEYERAQKIWEHVGKKSWTIPRLVFKN